MKVTRVRFLLGAALACAALLFGWAPAKAAVVNIPLAGNFTAGVTGGGSATLNGANGQFKQWAIFTHTTLTVSAGAQTVGLSFASVPTTNFNASGSSNLNYQDDINLGGPSPNQVNSLNVDLNGNSIIQTDLTVNPISIMVGSVPAQLQLSFDGQINQLDFVSTGPSPPGALYAVPGNFVANVSGVVNAALVNVPILGTINLGPIVNVTPTNVNVPGVLPGLVSLADGSGGLGPYPADLLANYAIPTLPNIAVPLNLPFNVAISQTIPNGQSGFSTLNASGTLNATLTLNNLSYNLNGTVDDAVVPEPASIVLGGLASIGLGLAAWKRRRLG